MWTSCFPEDEDDPDRLATSTTHALPRDAGPVDVAAMILNPGEMLLLCTDGLTRPMRGEQVRIQLAKWWSEPAPPSLSEFFWQLSFRVKPTTTTAPRSACGGPDVAFTPHPLDRQRRSLPWSPGPSGKEARVW